MNAAKTLRFAAWGAFAVALVMGLYLVKESKATSYLSNDATACINCHVMESAYASWSHSSHAQRAMCVDCHLPVDDYIDKYASKTRDGWNHSVAFTMNTYGKRILISDDGARRVQEKCIRCHASFTKPVTRNVDRQHAFDSANLGDRQCWDCHRLVPHGGVRSINAAPYNLGVKWNR